MLKMYGINFFSYLPPPPKRVCLYTRLNVDNYGWPLSDSDKPCFRPLQSLYSTTCVYAAL